jgi:ElaB/YqjD/DUF883 family membrane-anchored ribosome-binding protein
MPNSRSPQRAAAQEMPSIQKGFRDIGNAAKSLVNDSYESVRDSATEYMEQGKAAAYDMGEKVQKRVRDEPTKALLVAAAVGFVLGACWMRR